MCVWWNNMWQCLTAQQTSDSMLPSSSSITRQSSLSPPPNKSGEKWTCLQWSIMWRLCITTAKMSKMSDSDLPSSSSSSITSSSHSSTTGIMTYSVTNDQWMMWFLQLSHSKAVPNMLPTALSWIRSYYYWPVTALAFSPISNKYRQEAR